MKVDTKQGTCNYGNLPQKILAVGIIILLIITGPLNVNANIYINSHFTLHKKNICKKRIFTEVSSRIGYHLIGKFEGDNILKIRTNLSVSTLNPLILSLLKFNDFRYSGNKSIFFTKKLGYSSFAPDSIVYKGQVKDESGKALSGATIRVFGSSRSTLSDSNGEFSIFGPLKGLLRISYIGYLTQDFSLNQRYSSQRIIIKMMAGTNNLGEIGIVGTGYQDLPKERATGAFEVITKEQLRHSTDPNLIRRLEGITTSLDFNNNLTQTNSAATPLLVGLDGQYAKSAATNLTIRGRNTLVATNTPINTSGQVLVVIDGIASPYSVDRIDPDDVESVTILKDAAAASIWGSRAANGVIVVKTKKGNFDKPLQVSFNSNFNLTEKLDLFYRKTMSVSEYIDAQIFLFNSAGTTIGTPNVRTPQPFASPVAEILNRQKLGQITADESKRQIDNLRNYDIRKDYNKYFLKSASSQNYSLALDGGSVKYAYRVSGAYNKTLNNTLASGSDRISLNYNASIKPIKNVSVFAGLSYNNQRTNDQAQANPLRLDMAAPYYLYSRLVDDQGNPIILPYKYRDAFINLLNSTYSNKIQDLRFSPLNDINEGYTKTSSKNINFNLASTYTINDFLSINAIYNYSHGNSIQKTLNRQSSFYMRDLVSRFTMPSNYSDPLLGSLPYYQQIPLGGQLNYLNRETTNQTLRGQLNFNKDWNTKNSLNAIAGIDLTQNFSLTRRDQYYGYDENTLFTATRLNYFNLFTPLFREPGGGSFVRIPYSNSFADIKIRTYSLFANAAYTYDSKYTLSASVRKDVSSEFGLGTNKGGTPFYSFGGSWNIANERFYTLEFLPRLQLRATFGYNGNVNPQVTARPIINYSPGTGVNNLQSANTVADATNNMLRPEKTGIVNLGIDYGLKNNKISGTIEYYNKHTTDLITGAAIDPTTGYNYLSFNTASLRGSGFDVNINSQNLQFGRFNWNSTFLFSYSRVKVSKLYTPDATTTGDVVIGIPNYNVGYDLSRLFAYRWAGLDPNTGDPRTIVDGNVLSFSNTNPNSNAFTDLNNSSLSNARYFGSAVPVYFGSLRNTFNYGALSISINFLYKLGYYFRKSTANSVFYSQLLSGTNIVQGAEFSQRWQKPGDELTTNVPSMTYPAGQNRDLFYYYSEINVLKADHIRLQEINLSYSISKKNWFIKNPRIYANVSNLGIIWRANKLGIDPDINDYPNPKTYALGISANF